MGQAKPQQPAAGPGAGRRIETLALSGQATPSLRRLEAARESARRPTTADPEYLYWVTESQVLVVSAGMIFNSLKQPDPTITAVTAHLDRLDDANIGDRAFGLVRLGEAYSLKKEIPTAAAKLGEAVSLMSTYRSARLVQIFRTARARLKPWKDNSHVRELDERIRTPAMT